MLSLFQRPGCVTVKEIDTKLEGIVLFKQNRMNKRGGGAALFLMNSRKCKSIDQMSIVVDELMEGVTIQRSNGRAKNIIITFI